MELMTRRMMRNAGEQDIPRYIVDSFIDYHTDEIALDFIADRLGADADNFPDEDMPIYLFQLWLEAPRHASEHMEELVRWVRRRYAYRLEQEMQQDAECAEYAAMGL